MQRDDAEHLPHEHAPVRLPVARQHEHEYEHELDGALSSDEQLVLPRHGSVFQHGFHAGLQHGDGHAETGATVPHDRGL